jgi:plastocyanin
MRLSVLAFGFLTLVTAAACSSSSNPSSPSSGSLVTVQINNSTYAPNPMTMKVGQQVNWKNNDSITHTATLEGMFNNVISPNSAQGAPVTMNSAGTFNYHCTIHPGMNGTIVVQP